jgi:signal transduction histidine kinase
MSSRLKFSVDRGKSLYFSATLAMVAVLSLSFLAFQAIADHVQTLKINPVFERFDRLELEDARGLLETGGKEALQKYMAHLDEVFGGSHYLLDAHGLDVLSGENRSNLLPRPPADRSRTPVTQRSPDGRYWFVAISLPNMPHIWTFLPYYFLVIAATGVLCWLVAVGVVSPIRGIAARIAAFGGGDLSARVHLNREDEIGQLGRSFNEMAERLELLILSERRLMGDISHEIRSPLARLKVAVKLARTSSDSKAALDRIDRDLDRLTSLVSDIMEITLVEGDPALRESNIVSVPNLIQEVVHDCALEAQLRGCNLQVDDTCCGAIQGNHELLRRAIENVVRNAVRFAPEHSSVSVRAVERDQHMVVSVRDHGTGVPEAALDRIFDPFFRVEEARDVKSGGTGLGLSIAKRAVQLHRGTIRARNAYPGLRVEIVIPLVATAISE